MTMKYLMPCFVLCALVMVGCADQTDNDSTEGAVAPATPMTGLEALPFQASFMWGITNVQWAGVPGSGVKSTFDGRCPCEAEAIIWGHGEGQATHAGRVSSTTSQCMNFVWGPISRRGDPAATASRIRPRTAARMRFTSVDESPGSMSRLEALVARSLTMVGGTGLF
jgi:hypothetical protein